MHGGSWVMRVTVKGLVGQMGHGSQNMTLCHLWLVVTKGLKFYEIKERFEANYLAENGEENGDDNAKCSKEIHKCLLEALLGFAPNDLEIQRAQISDLHHFFLSIL